MRLGFWLIGAHSVAGGRAREVKIAGFEEFARGPVEIGSAIRAMIEDGADVVGVCFDPPDLDHVVQHLAGGGLVGELLIVRMLATRADAGAP